METDNHVRVINSRMKQTVVLTICLLKVPELRTICEGRKFAKCYEKASLTKFVEEH